MKKIKFIAAAAAAFALAAFVLVGCSSGGSASSSAASASASASASAAASASASASASAAASESASASASAAASESASASASTSEATPASDFKLVVGFDAEYPPYGFMAEDGTYTGFDLDLAAEASKRLGWEFEAEPIDWDAKDALLKSGTINCIWNGFTMEGREGEYTFSEPYMLNEQVVVVKADSDIKELSDLAEKTVLTQAGSAAEEVLTGEGDQAELGATFKELVTIADYNNAFMQLESGAVDAIACDLSIAEYQMAANAGKYVKLAEPLSSEHYAVGFALGEEDTAAQISETLKAMYEDGTVEKICGDYAEYGLSFDNWVLK